MRHFDLIVGTLAWAAVFFIMKPRRIIQLWPAGVVSVFMLLGSVLFFQSLQIFGYENPALPILGIPLGFLLLAAAGGIIAMNFMPEDFSKKLLLILVFAVALQIIDQLALSYGNHFHHNSFKWYHNLYQIFVTLSVFVFITEGLFGTKIHK